MEFAIATRLLLHRYTNFDNITLNRRERIVSHQIRAPNCSTGFAVGNTISWANFKQKHIRCLCVHQLVLRQLTCTDATNDVDAIQ